MDNYERKHQARTGAQPRGNAMRRTPATRGDETRKKLVDAAVRLFATTGYHAVSTREIARAAGVNPAAIGFHFKGKEGLYAAVIDIMVETFRDICTPMVAVIDDNIRSCAGDRDKLRELTRRAVDQFLSAAMLTEWSRWLGILLQREYVDPTNVFETIYTELIEPVLEAIERLVQAATGPEETPQRRLRVCCIMAQLTNLGGDRAILRRRFGRKLDAPEMLTALVAIVTEGVCGLLGL